MARRRDARPRRSSAARTSKLARAKVEVARDATEVRGEGDHLSGDREDVDFGILLGLAYQGFVEQLHADLAKRGFDGVGPSVGYVVRAVAAESLNQRQLAARLGITDQGAGQLVEEMVRERYIARVTDPSDARARRLVLGERGKALLKAARAFHARFERELASRLGEAQVAATRVVLAEIVAGSSSETARKRLRPM